MTLRLTVMKSVALVSASALHLLILQPWQTPEPALTEAGSGAAIATLGTSFVDMVAGTQQPARPQQTLTADPTKDETEHMAAQPAPQPATVKSARPLEPQRKAARPVAETEHRPPTKDVTEATTPPRASTSLTTSLRPKLRPDRPQPARSPAPPPADTGQAAQNAVQGVASGQASATAKTQGRPTAKPSASGTAAATNYPGVVMRYIARQRRPDLGVRGTAVIDFTIAPDGRLAQAQVARSSGSSALDRAALQIVQRAAPFPPPPDGARRSHSVGIKGRG